MADVGPHSEKTYQDLTQKSARPTFRVYHVWLDALGPTMPSDATNQATRREWRELGFFYDRNDETKTWRLVGSRSGLLRFRDVLTAYADDPSNDYKSEHEHYGPYYLEIMTWPEPGFDDHAIHGSLADLKRFAVIVENRLAVAQLGDSICIQDEFAANSPYGLILEVREDDFDPAQADPMLAKEAR